MDCSYSKLKNGDWGIRVLGEANSGDVLSVVTKAGKVTSAVAGRLIWSGEGVQLWTILKEDHAAKEQDSPF